MASPGPIDQMREPFSVLIVDDVRLERKILRRFLEGEGYDVSTARDGMEALELLQAKRFDLVLLDIIMPRMYGNKVLQRMRANPRMRHIPVIMMSAVDDTENIARCIELGAEDYMTKPHNRVLLKARISNCLQKKVLRDQEALFLKKIEDDKQQTERLLFNMVPQPIAEKLKTGERVIVDYFSEVTVMFADIVGYTRMSSRLPTSEMIEILHSLFSTFDGLTQKYGLEKIKTIGDSYMVVGGIPEYFVEHATAIAEMAMEMREVLKEYKTSDGQMLSMRFGINTGPVRVGIIGTRKFSYDLWGDTVNIASRMESHGMPDEIHVSEVSAAYLEDYFHLEKRAETIHIKGKGDMATFFLKAPKKTPQTADVLPDEE